MMEGACLLTSPEKSPASSTLQKSRRDLWSLDLSPTHLPKALGLKSTLDSLSDFGLNMSLPRARGFPEPTSTSDWFE